jgi:hypothetical protein
VFCLYRLAGNTSGITSRNGVVVVCGGDVEFCMEDVVSGQ